MVAPSLAPLQELPPDQLRVVDDLVEIVVIAQRLLHSLRVGSDQAAVQRVNRVLAVVEAGKDRRELVGGAAVPTEQTLPHARDVEARIGSRVGGRDHARPVEVVRRSEEHTSELQSQSNLVCRLLLEKKNAQFFGD